MYNTLPVSLHRKEEAFNESQVFFFFLLYPSAQPNDWSLIGTQLLAEYIN